MEGAFEIQAQLSHELPLIFILKSALHGSLNFALGLAWLSCLSSFYQALEALLQNVICPSLLSQVTEAFIILNQYLSVVLNAHYPEKPGLGKKL